MAFRDKEVTISGGGLVGTLTAIALAKRGIRAHLIERRGDMRKEKVAAGRSINLAISRRGLHALAEFGIEKDALSVAIPMRGRMIHAIDGQLTFQAYGQSESECINSISRAGLNELLLNFASREEGIRISFHQRIAGFDPEEGRLTLKDERTGETSESNVGVMFGADGYMSAIREALETRSGLTVTPSPLDYGYKELCIPAKSPGEFFLEKHALHIWPRGSFMLIALPNIDGSFTCTLFLPHKGKISFQSLTSEPEIQKFFEKYFSDALKLMPTLIEDFAQNPTGQMVTIRAFPWHFRDRAVLIGDAAHAIVPFFGQGMNCGFEDVTELGKILDEMPNSPWGNVFLRFEKARKTNADAIADMAIENFLEMRDRVGDPRFLIQKEMEKILEREFKGKYVSRYRLVSFSLVPYRKAFEIGVVGSSIVDELSKLSRDANDFDRELAARLIETKLAPELKGIHLP